MKIMSRRWRNQPKGTQVSRWHAVKKYDENTAIKLIIWEYKLVDRMHNKSLIKKSQSLPKL